MTECVEQIRAAGLVGMGGAGFPTHVKLNGPIEHLIVNGLECEPLLGTDRYAMRHEADKLVSALVRIKTELSIGRATFCLKKTYTDEIAALRTAIARANAPVALHTTESFYPAGDEHVVVYEVTGKTVPPLNIPLSVGAAVMNVGTLLAAYDAFNGVPLSKRLLTVAGEVKTPVVLLVPIGTPFSLCIEAAGGMTRDNCWIVSGGPMMGKPYEPDALEMLFVGKTTSGILVLPKERYHAASADIQQIRLRARAACIQCSYCTELCPRHMLGHPLEPHRIMRKLAYERMGDVLSDPVIQSAALCSECGVCEVYACPMGLQPRSVNALIKGELGRAGIRYPKSEESTPPHPMRSSRLAPTKRIAARAGVLQYMGEAIDRCVALAPTRVALSLRQGIGAPSVPVVAVGERVRTGQKIAACPEGKLGAELHASIDGVVTDVGEQIVIEREDGK